MVTKLLEGSDKLEMRSLLYEWLPRKLEILGANGLILPLLAEGIFPSTTFNTIGDLQATFTWDADITSRVTYENGVPVVTFDGIDDQADAPDNAYWTRAAATVSWGAWIRIVGSQSGFILAKHDATSDQREWQFQISGADKLASTLVDEDAVSNHVLQTIATPAVTADKWALGVATFDGSADASGLNLYIDGVLVASGDTDQPNFVSMRDKTESVTLGYQQTSGPETFYKGKMAGSSLGPFFTFSELNADQILRIYQAEAKLLGVYQ
ncbi:MAG: hypothetical protein J3T61_04630 [Candidatus Brocadiales bacterium]|nr:hypothetical protein [Candidatus Bathyanammoxibius sp.]